MRTLREQDVTEDMRMGAGGMHFRPRGVRIRPQELGPQNEGPEAEGPTAHTVLQAQNWPANKSQRQLTVRAASGLPAGTCDYPGLPGTMC